MGMGGDRHMGREFVASHDDVRACMPRFELQPHEVVNVLDRKKYRSAQKVFKPFMYEWVNSHT
jgi:hypothetical protein